MLGVFGCESGKFSLANSVADVYATASVIFWSFCLVLSWTLWWSKQTALWSKDNYAFPRHFVYFLLGYFNCIPFSDRLVSVSLPLGRNNPVTTFEMDRVISQMLPLRHTDIENSKFWAGNCQLCAQVQAWQEPGHSKPFQPESKLSSSRHWDPHLDPDLRRWACLWESGETVTSSLTCLHWLGSKRHQAKFQCFCHRWHCSPSDSGATTMA